MIDTPREEPILRFSRLFGKGGKPLQFAPVEPVVLRVPEMPTPLQMAARLYQPLSPGLCRCDEIFVLAGGFRAAACELRVEHARKHARIVRIRLEPGSALDLAHSDRRRVAIMGSVLPACFFYASKVVLN